MPFKQKSPLEIQMEAKVDDDTRERVQYLARAVEESYTELGGHLFKIKANKAWEDWDYESFEEYVDQELGFRRRKALYLISIFKTFCIDLAVPPQRVAEVSWSKCKEMVSVVTKENVDAWLETAKKLTISQLREEVKREKTDDEDAEVARPWSVSLFPDQKQVVDEAIEIALEETDSDKRGYGLSCVALEFASSRGPQGGRDSAAWLRDQIAALEETTGFKILAFDEEATAQRVLDYLQNDENVKIEDTEAEAEEADVDVEEEQEDTEAEQVEALAESSDA